MAGQQGRAAPRAGGRVWGQPRRRAGTAIAALALALGLALGFGGATRIWAEAIGPALRVNQDVVTTYELAQRILLMELLNQPGDIPALARTSLIDDRLRQAAARDAGVTVSDEEVLAGMSEFAGRGQLALDQLLQLFGQKGIDAAALRDFVRAGLEWRGAVRAKFAGQVFVSEAEIDRAIAAGAAAGGELSVLLSVIFLPEGGEDGDPATLAQRIIEGSHSLNGFQIFAKKFSKAPNAAAGGNLDWTLLSALPPGVGPAVEALAPGEMSAPLPVEGGLAVYYLRDESETAGEGRPSHDVSFARLGFAGAAAAQAVAARVQRCGDLYPAARGLPEEALVRDTLAESALPGDLAADLAALDPGETRLRPLAQGGTELLMLCDRVPQTKVPASRDAVRNQLLNRKLALLSEGWLEELRQGAIVTDY